MRSITFSDEFWQQLYADLATMSLNPQLQAANQFQDHLESLYGTQISDVASSAAIPSSSLDTPFTTIRRKRNPTLSTDMSAEASRVKKVPRSSARNDGKKRVSQPKNRGSMTEGEQDNDDSDADSGEYHFTT
jgi:hypothetical protein